MLRFDDLCAFFNGKDSLYIEWELKSKPVDLYPEAELLLISSRPLCDETIRLARTTGIMTLGCTMDGTTREAVARAHREGITVSLWPGKSVDDFLLGVYLGADRLCTDVPVAVKQFAETNLPWINAKY